MPGPLKKLLSAIADRAAGIKPGVFRALLIAISVGFMAAVATYKLLRSGD